MSSLDFYFDFSSPYGYLAAMQIDEFAARHGRAVVWKPILLGAVFKVTGGKPLLPGMPLKGEYSKRDIARSARYHGIPLKIPSKFPIATQVPARAFYWTSDRDQMQAQSLAKSLLRAYFVDDRDISSPEATADIAAMVGLRRADVLAALSDEAVKTRLKIEVDEALARGVFGSPYFLIDGEPFWGLDRLEQMERWLKNGPY